MRYVELNPVRAGLVKDPKDYRWSSYRNNALGIKDTLVVAHPLYQSLGNSAAERQEKWRELCQEALRTDQLVEVRHRVQYGGVQGTPTLRVPGAPIDTSIRVRI
jgi:putative transposase